MKHLFDCFKFLVSAIGLIALLTACGGSGSGSKKATITFSVDDILVTQKKSKSSDDIKEISITDLEGNEIGTAKEVDTRVYEVEVDEDISLDIKITLVNSNNGEITLERIIEEAKTEEVTVDQESTHIATYVRESATENDEDIKTYLEARQGELDKIKELLNDISDKEYINKLLATSDTQDLDQLSETIAKALEELERVTAILERIQDNIDNFQSGSSDVGTNEEGEHNLSLESVADQIEGQDEENDATVEIGEDGAIVVSNSEGTKNVTTEITIQKEPIVSGETISSSESAIVIGSKTETGLKEITIYNNGSVEYITKLLNNIHPGDYVIVKYEENDSGEKIIAKISGSGYATGLVSVIKDAGLTIVDDNNYSTEFTARYVTNEATGVSGYDPEVIAFIATLKVNDEVKIKWEINERKRIIAIEKITDSSTEEPVIDEPVVDEPVTEEPTTPTVPESLKFSGKVNEKNDLGFSLLQTSGESVFIYINGDIAYHKEILASLLVGDEIVVVGHKADGYIMDTASGDGSMSGTLIEKGESAIYVKNSEGKTVKFTPEWHDGGLDAAMLAQFQELAVGASITVKWKLDERKRAISISLN